MGLQGSVVTAIKLHEGAGNGVTGLCGLQLLNYTRGQVMGLQGSVVTAIKLHEGAGNGVARLCGYSY